MTKPNICVLGTGYVGLTTGACLSQVGYAVTCLDIDEEKIASLKAGGMPIYEPGLSEIVALGLRNGRLAFSTDIPTALTDADTVFLCLPTPTMDDGLTDLRPLFTAIESSAKFLKSSCVVVNKSTVPIGTTEQIESLIGRHDVSVASNPEFLREGQAVSDFLHPDRIVIGAEDDHSRQLLTDIYSPFGAPILCTSRRSAETVKYMANAYLATRLSFVNQIAGFCHATGADLEQVLEGLAYDPRVGSDFFSPGPGWGGSCFPKDTHSLERTAAQFGFRMTLVEEARRANISHIAELVEFIDRTVASKFGIEARHNHSIGLWGLSFKANTDDVRDSPAVAIARALVNRGYNLRIYDAVAQPVSDLQAIRHAAIEDSVRNVDLLVIATEWREFVDYDPERLAHLMRGRDIIDLRYVVERNAFVSHGFTVHRYGG